MTDKCIILQLWRSEVRNGSHWAKGKVLAGLPSLLRRLFHCLVQLLGVTYASRLVTPSHLQNHPCPMEPFSQCHFYFFLFCLLLPHWRTFVITLGPLIANQLINSLNGICNLHFSLPCNITYLQILGFRKWESLGSYYSAYYIP